jgi:CRISPR-associated endonuclease Cas3-HD
MKPCAFIKQSLYCHTVGVTERAAKFASFQYDEICRKRLSKMGLSFDLNSIRNAILLSAILHDIGKSAHKYQSQFDDKCKSCTHQIPSFYLHEVSSAIISKRICDYNNFERPLSFLIVASVLQHLHAMRGMDRDRTINDSIRNFAKNTDYGMFNQYSIALYQIVSKICQVQNIMIGLNFDLFGDIKSDEVRDLFRWIKKTVEEKYTSRWVKLYILFLNPIIIGDNLDSYSNRNQSQESKNKSSFMKELASSIEE